MTLGLPPTGADPIKRRRPGRSRDLVALAQWAVAYEDSFRTGGGRRINHRLAAQRWPSDYERDRVLEAAEPATEARQPGRRTS
jgi:hypothetical protein